MSSIFTSAKQTISLGQDIAQIIKTLKDKDEILVHQLSNLITGGSINPELAEALSEDQQALVKQFFEKISDKVDLNATLRSLISPLNELNPYTPLSWPWIRRDGILPNKGDLTVSLGGSLGIAVSILPGPAYHITGNLGIASSLKLPFSFGSASLNLEVSNLGKISAEFMHQPEEPVIEALIADLPQLTALTELAQLQSEPFQTATLEVTGAINVSVALTAGKTFIIDRKLQSSTVTARAEVGLSYMLNWAKQGRYKITITNEPDGTRLSVLQQHQHESARTLSIGAEVSFNGIRDAVAPVMQRIVQFPVPLEEAIRKYSKPGDIIKGKLTTLLSSQDDEIIALANVITGDGSSEDFIFGLINIIAEEFDVKSDWFNNALDARFEDFITKLTDRLPTADPEIRGQFRDLVEAKLRSAVDSLELDMGAEVRTLLADSGDIVAKALHAFSEEAQEITGSLDNRAKKLLIPFKQAISRYREIEEQLTFAVEAVEKEKLAIRFSRVVSKTDNEELLMDVLIKEVNDDTGLLYQQMLTGDFGQAFQAGLDSNNHTVTLGNSVYTRLFERSRTTGITFNLFGFEFSSSSAISSELQVSTEGGVINLLQGSGKVTSQNNWFGEKLSVKISNLVNFIDAQGSENVLSIYATYIDPDLNRREIKEFLQPFEDRQLINDGATSRTINAIGAEQADGTIQLTTVLGFSRAEVDQVAQRSEEEIITTALFEQVDSLNLSNWARPQLEDLVSNFQGNPSAASAIHHFHGQGSREILRKLGAGTGLMDHDTQKQLILIQHVNNNGDDLVEYINLWRQLQLFPLPEIEGGIVNKKQFEELEHLLESMIARLEGWAQASGIIRSFSGAGLSPWSLAFFMTMRALSGQSAKLVPIVSWQEEGRIRRIAVV